MRFSILAASLFAAVAVAQNCGPSYGNQKCAAGKCCSQYGWCDVGPAYCDPATCQKAYSGTGSSCASSTSNPYASSVPNIDVCGDAQGGVSCPGAGEQGYFYRCCSSHGHCGPKNNIQDQSLYCGTGCQKGFGACDTRPLPPNPTGTSKIAQNGDTCGPIVNAKCASGLCCSGSNFCGTTSDFCGAANWCQPKWGKCS